jgi:hypothetical protein
VLEVLVTEGSVDLLVPALRVLSLQPQRLPRVIPQSVARSDRVARNRGRDLPLDDVVGRIQGGIDPSPPGTPGAFARRCMPTMARSMTQFGLLMILVVLPVQMLLWWCHARESMPTNRIHRSTFRGNRKAVMSKSTARCGLYSPNSFFVGEVNLTRSTPLA